MPQISSHPWDIDAQEYPRDGSPQERLAFALRYAILAPSAHNTQPWRFRIRGDMVELHVDRSRVLPIADPAGRELMISCGAALFFLRITLRRFGHAPNVVLNPDSVQPSLVACLWLGERAEPTADEAVLAEAIPHRHTNRRAFDERPVPSELTLALVRAAAAEGAWLEAVADPERKRSLAGLVAQAHAEQLADEAFVGELASWVRDPAAEDGMATHGVPLDEVGAPHASAFLRTFEATTGAAATEAQLTAGSPLLAVLGTTEDDTAAWLRCGQALGHVLLRACAEGLSASFLNQPIEVASLRPEVAPAIAHNGHAHVLLRLGFGDRAPATPRRPLAEMLDG